MWRVTRARGPTRNLNEIISAALSFAETFPPSAFSLTRETPRSRDGAFGGRPDDLESRNSAAVTHVTNRATFRAERRRSMPEEDRVSGRGAFPTRKLPWVIPRSTRTEIREKFSELASSSPITQRSGKVQRRWGPLPANRLSQSVERDCTKFSRDSLNRLFVPEIS